MTRYSSIKEGNSSGRFYIKYLDGVVNEYKGYLVKVPNMGADDLGFRYFLIPSSRKKINGDYFQGIPVNKNDIKEVPYPNYMDFVSEFNNVGYEGDVNFRNGKKPVDFIKKIIEISGLNTKENPIIMDYFAGSGSTAQAVLEINNEETNAIQFILITNNENNICNEICFPRIDKVINGYKSSKGEIYPPQKGNLKYFKTDFVPGESTDANKALITKRSVEMLCLREGTFDEEERAEHWRFYKNKEKHTAILFEPELVEDFRKRIEQIEGVVSVYVFSLSNDTYAEAFEGLEDKVTLCAVPESILKVYRRIYQ